MPTAFSQRFLTIVSALLFLLLVVGYFSTIGKDEQHLLTWEYHTLQLLLMSSALLLAVFLEVVYQKRTDLAKTLALMLIILQGIVILYRFYQLGSMLFETDFGSAKYFFYTLILQLPWMLFPIGLLLMGISYYNTEKLFGYSNRTLLLIYSVSSLIGRFFFLLLYFASKLNDSDMFAYVSYTDQLYYLIDPLFDIAMLLFIFSGSTHQTIPTPEPDKNPDLLDAETVIFQKEESTYASVLWWLGKYLLLMIPLVNIIFLLIWSGKNQPRLIRNWAVGQYWVTCLGVILATFMVYNSGDSESLPTMILLFLPIITIIIGIVLLTRADQPQSITDDSPGIGTWLGRIFLAGIPLIGWIFLIVHATDQSDRTRQNWAKSQLLLIAVNVIFYVNYLNTIDRIQNMLSYTQFAF